jgi:PAS domain S-box-containing protein
MPPRTKFGDLLETLPDALVGVDASGVIQVVNQQAEALFGYGHDDLIGASVETLVPDRLRLTHVGHRAAFSSDRATRAMGTDLRLIGQRRDGTEFPVDIALSCMDSGEGVLVIASVRDMSERLKTESSRHRLDRLAAIVEHSDDAIISSTLDGIITSWNPAAERLYGYTSEEVIGRSIQPVTPQDRAGEVKAMLDKITAGEPVDHYETIRVRKDGTMFPASVSVSPIRDEFGKITGASVISRDVTQRGQALASAQQMASVVEQSSDAIIGSTLEGIITSWNPAAEGMFGYSSQEIIGQHGTVLGPEDRAEEIRDLLARASAGHLVGPVETVRARKDATQFPVSLTASPIRDEYGTIIGAASIVRDVTEQRKAIEVAQRMAAIIQGSNDAIISSTLDGILTSWNPAAERLYGYTSQEIVGRSTDLLSPKDHVGDTSAILGKITAGEHVEHHHTTRIRKDGTRVRVSLTASPIRDASGAIIGASLIARDLTRQEEASELFRSMIEASQDSMVSISMQGKITDVNEVTVKITGVPRDKLIGTSFSRCFTDPEKAEQAYQKVFERGSVTDYPLTLRRGDGSEVLTEVLYNASVYRDAEGKVLGVFATARDVTQLREAAQYSRSLIEAALDPMVTISPEGKITDVNQATVTATGLPRDKLIGTSFSSYFTDPEKANQGYQRVFEQGAVTDLPLTLRHHDGQRRIEVLYNASLYHDRGGHVLGVFASARDVTKRILAQREVAHQQAKELDRLAELERFQRLTVGRELKMIELKKQIEYLKKLGPADGGERGEQH